MCLPLRVLGFLVAFALVHVPSPVAADPGFVILCNASNPLVVMSSMDLKKALSGSTKMWSNGAVVQVGIMPLDSRELAALSSAVGMTPPELLGRMQQQVFKGEMRRPVLLRSGAECVGLARSNAGAICVAARSARLPPEVKVVSVNVTTLGAPNR